MKSLKPYRLLATLHGKSLGPLFSIDTHLTDKERFTLYQLSRRASALGSAQTNIVEIGSYLGASAAFLAAGLKSDNDRVYCIDTWENDAMSEGGRDTFAEFEVNTLPFRSRITPLRGRSDEPHIVDEIARHAQPIHLLFIDGDHSYEAVLTDWETYSPFLAKGSYVVMHDIGWAEGVQRVVGREIRPLVHDEHRLSNLWWGQIAK